MRPRHFAIMVVVLFSASSVAQMRGSAGRGFVGRQGFRGRPGVVVAPPHPGLGFAGGVHNRPIVNNGPFFTCGLNPCSRRIFVPIWWGSLWDNAYTVPDPLNTDNFDTQPPAYSRYQPPGLPSKVEVTLVDQRESDNAEAKKLPNAKIIEVPAQPAIFVFKNGTRKEMTSFAITGGRLVDLSKEQNFTIPLDQIDRKATLAANAKAGRDIQMAWLQ